MNWFGSPTLAAAAAASAHFQNFKRHFQNFKRSNSFSSSSYFFSGDRLRAPIRTAMEIDNNTAIAKGELSLDPETEFLASKRETGHEWELFKENVRPLKRGRNVAILNHSLKSHTDSHIRKSLLENRRYPFPLLFNRIHAFVYQDLEF